MIDIESYIKYLVLAGALPAGDYDISTLTETDNSRIFSIKERSVDG